MIHLLHLSPPTITPRTSPRSRSHTFRTIVFRGMQNECEYNILVTSTPTCPETCPSRTRVRSQKYNKIYRASYLRYNGISFTRKRARVGGRGKRTTAAHLQTLFWHVNACFGHVLCTKHWPSSITCIFVSMRTPMDASANRSAKLSTSKKKRSDQKKNVVFTIFDNTNNKIRPH